MYNDVNFFPQLPWGFPLGMKGLLVLVLWGKGSVDFVG